MYEQAIYGDGTDTNSLMKVKKKQQTPALKGIVNMLQEFSAF
jgi:hypothetical protein